MPAQLVALTEGPNILLDKPIILVGRHQECDIQIPSRKVSRRHCCLAQVNDHIIVRDLCSTNGIRINGTRIQEGNLKPGDELTIGSYKYQLSWPSQEPSAEPVNGKAGLPRLVAMEDQAHLESCDEPVALADPRLMPPNPSFPPLLPLNKTNLPMPKRLSDARPGAPEVPPVGIPDDMALRPMHDSHAPPAAKAGS